MPRVQSRRSSFSRPSLDHRLIRVTPNKSTAADSNLYPSLYSPDLAQDYAACLLPIVDLDPRT